MSFTTGAAKKFNEENIDDSRVYYQSYASVMKNCFSDIFMWFPNLIVGLIEGEGVSDIVDLYKKIIYELGERGF